jgi:amidophosphoribosyltransferase
MMDRLNPKRIVIVSSAPTNTLSRLLRNWYGKASGLVAFRAALELLKERDLYDIVAEVYAKCKAQENFWYIEFVTTLFTLLLHLKRFSDKIAEMLNSK